MKVSISVIGLGYIGLPFALLLNKYGYNVDGVDKNKQKIKKLLSGKFRSGENEINKIYEIVRKSNSLNFTTKLKSSNFYILCLPTPIKKNFKCDLSFLINATKQISKVIKAKNTIVVESTVPIGTTAYLFSLMNKLRPDLKKNFNICFIPEKAIPGKTLYEMRNNYRIIGSNKKTFNIVKKIYEKFTKNKIKNYKIEEAEASKLVENSFRDNQIAFSHYIDTEFKKLNLDTKKIIEICNKHPRVNLLNPSIGVGGHCIPIDPYFLNFKKNKKNMILISRKINNERSYIIANKINKLIKIKKKENVCLWGLGYKPGSTDLRESPAVKIIKLLKKNKFHISDPFFSLLKKEAKNFKNFISPKNALKKCKFHIILNLEKKFINTALKKHKYIYAKNL